MGAAEEDADVEKHNASLHKMTIDILKRCGMQKIPGIKTVESATICLQL